MMAHHARILCSETGSHVSLTTVVNVLDIDIFTGTGNGGVGGVTQAGCLLFKFRGGVGKSQGYKQGERYREGEKSKRRYKWAPF